MIIRTKPPYGEMGVLETLREAVQDGFISEITFPEQMKELLRFKELQEKALCEVFGTRKTLGKRMLNPH